MFQVLIGKKPRKFYCQLELKLQKKLQGLFEILEINPWPAKEYDLAKLQDLKDCFRIRLGQFRICYHVDAEAKEITVYRLERRSEKTYR